MEQDVSYQDNVTSNHILIQLEQLHSKVLEQQKNALAEVLNLQRMLNKLHTTTYIRQKVDNDTKKQVKQQKKQFNIQKLGKKMQQLLDETQQINVNQPIKLLKKQFQKPMQKPVQIIQKKPSVPTVNRTNNITKTGVIPRYVPPRNKNQVTGKVTQNKISVQQKVFRPQLKMNPIPPKVQPKFVPRNMSQKKITSTTATTQNNIKTNQTKHINSTNNISSQKQLSKQKKQSKQQKFPKQPELEDANAVAQYKKLRSKQQIQKFHSFTKSTQELLSDVNNKKNNHKRLNFKQLIDKYLNQEMGHKAIEQKKRRNFLNHFKNYSFSKNCSIPEITVSAPKRYWQEYQHIFSINNILEQLQEDIQKLAQCQRDNLRLDPKQVYKAKLKSELIQEQVQKINLSTQIFAPQKLQLTFKTIQPKQVQTSNPQQTINFSILYQKISSLLQQVQKQDNLTKQKLGDLKFMSEIIIYNGKRTPLIVKTDQFQQWKMFYQDDLNDGRLR